MLTRLQVTGFKCFDNEDFSISPLTLLSGLNSSGKSTFLQAIRLIYGKPKSLDMLGKMDDLISSSHRSTHIKLTSYSKEYNFNHPVTEKNYDYPYVEPTLISYISANRLGPELYLPFRQSEEKGFDVGERGEFVLEFLEHHYELSGLPNLLKIPETKSSGVIQNISAWLDMITPGIKFVFEAIPKADLARAEYSGRRPNNVGFGLSYTLPIIANVLVYAAKISRGEEKSSVILIENPEAHLHPEGQTKLGEFLARAASCGVQIIMETHSDHILNGIRLAVKDSIIEASDTRFYYFTFSFDEEKTTVYNPKIDRFGFFDEWPDGFFDETEKTLERLL